jgi:hypothetical protein
VFISAVRVNLIVGQPPALVTAPEMSAFIGFLKSLNTGVDVRFATFRALPAMLRKVTLAVRAVNVDACNLQKRRAGNQPRPVFSFS